ncbi:hypothetical protein L1887_55180 [Cichorium endivia]|nr:hypothetical protein L1887_55180 [Cichorium endivia]
MRMRMQEEEILSLALDDRGGVLGDTVDGGLDVRGDVEGHDGGVDDTQVGGAVHAQVGVDHAALVAGQHGSSADGVVLGDRGGLGVVLQVDVAGPVLADDHVARVLGRVGRLDVHGTAREEVLVGCQDGEVGLGGLGRTGAGKVAVDADELHLADLVRVVVEEVELLVERGLVRGARRLHVLRHLVDHRLGTVGTHDAGERDVRDRGHGLGEDGGLVGLVRSQLLSGEGGVGAERVERLEAGLEVVHGGRVGVVLEVLTHVGVLVEHLDAGLAEDVLGANTGELEELRGVDGTSREDDLLGGVDGVRLAAVGEGDALGPELAAAGVEVDLGGEGVGEDVEVGSRLVGEEVGGGRVGSGVVGGVDVRGLLGDADILTGEGLVVLGDAELEERGDPAADLLGDVVGEGDLDGAGGAVVGGDGLDAEQVGVLLRGSVEALGLLHSLVEVVPVPAGVAELLPGVDLVAGGAVPDEEVERRGAAEDAATGPAAGGDAVGGVGDSGVVPVVLGAQVGAELAGGVDDADAVAAATGLEHTDLVLAVLGETRGEGETGGTGADDDVVVLLGDELGGVVGDGARGEVRVLGHASGHLATRADLGPCDGGGGDGAGQSGGGDDGGGLHSDDCVLLQTISERDGKSGRKEGGRGDDDGREDG